jgi:hypothetical protein
MIDRTQAHLVADLVRTVRSGWDTRAIVAALEPLRDRELADVVAAAIRAAQNQGFRTPAAIGFEGDHWRQQKPTKTRQQVDDDLARSEQRRQEIAHCLMCDGDGRLPAGWLCTHDPELAPSAAAGAALARARIRPTLRTAGDA